MICRQCFNENVEGAEACAFCGANMTILVEEQAGAKVYCTQCGTENREDALTCVSCRRLMWAAPEVPPDFRPSPHPQAGDQEFPPRSLIDLIGETLNLYRKHLGPFIAIALFSQFGALGAYGSSSIFVLISSLASLVLFGAWGWGGYGGSGVPALPHRQGASVGLLQPRNDTLVFSACDLPSPIRPQLDRALHPAAN